MQQDRIAEQRTKVQEHLRLENEHDWTGVHATFAQTGKSFFELVPFETKMDGIPGIETAYRLLSTALPDVHLRF